MIVLLSCTVLKEKGRLLPVSLVILTKMEDRVEDKKELTCAFDGGKL